MTSQPHSHIFTSIVMSQVVEQELKKQFDNSVDEKDAQSYRDYRVTLTLTPTKYLTSVETVEDGDVVKALITKVLDEIKPKFCTQMLDSHWSHIE